MFIQSCVSAGSGERVARHREAGTSSRIAAQCVVAAVASLGAGLVLAASPSESKEAARASQVGGHSEGRFILGWDRDGDGKVSRAEYEAARKERFVATDEDGNGTLSAEEYADEYVARLDRQIAGERKASIEQTHTRFRALDKDGDGFVSRAEYDASGARAFDHLDHDKDGRIAKQDPEKPRAESAKATAAQGEKPARQPAARLRSVVGMPSTHNRAGFLTIYDADGAGVVAREQYNAMRASAFASTDTHSDGKLDESEYVDEFADRLDRQIDRVRRGQLKQAHVRFESIDASKDGGISRDEYFAMSTRMFERADTNKDGTVSQEDPPPARERSAR
jgi:Ca2+-binding EF-hand superfamily protein